MILDNFINKLLLPTNSLTVEWHQLCFNYLVSVCTVKPILVSFWAGCKSKVISSEFIATLQTFLFTCNIAASQTIIFTQFVVFQCKQ